MEAALTVPLFFFVILYFLYLGLTLETGIRFGNSLNETGKQLAVAAYTTEYAGDWTTEKALAAGAISGIYAKHDILARTGELTGVRNVTLIQSEIMGDDQLIDLVLNYETQFLPFGLGLFHVPMVQRARIRAWTGDDGKAGAPEGAEEKVQYVYVTENGSVYHKSMSCSHLRLSTREVSFSDLSGMRNESGGKYYPCERCGNGPHERVYITNEGGKFHTSLSCSGLKRTVKKVPVDEIGSLPPCSRCGG